MWFGFLKGLTNLCERLTFLHVNRLLVIRLLPNHAMNKNCLVEAIGGQNLLLICNFKGHETATWMKYSYTEILCFNHSCNLRPL